MDRVSFGHRFLRIGFRRGRRTGGKEIPAQYRADFPVTGGPAPSSRLESLTGRPLS